MLLVSWIQHGRHFSSQSARKLPSLVFSINMINNYNLTLKVENSGSYSSLIHGK